MSLRVLIAAATLLCASGASLAQSDLPALQTAAEAGDASAAYEYGYALTFPADGAPDYEMGRSWLDQAAAADHAGALHVLGLIYRDGIGVDSDVSQARASLERAQALGAGAASLDLAHLYLFDIPGEVSRGTALLDGLRNDPEIGPDAGLMLAEYLFFDAEDASGEVRAIELANAAIEQRPDLFQAYYLAGIGAMEGIGRDAEPETARTLWSRGARGGDTLSMLALADALRDGLGGPVDAIEALALYLAADALGDPDAYDAFVELDAVLNAEERAEAERRSEDFLSGLS
jgi:TPR repeat protein